MRRWLLPLVVLGVALAATLALPGGLAQEAPPSEAPSESHGFLYFTDTVRGFIPYSHFNAMCEPPGEYPRYEATPEVPRQANVTKAHTSAHFGVLSCLTYFGYQAPESFSLGPELTVTFWVGCDQQSPMLSTPDVNRDYAVQLYHEGEVVAEHDGNYPDRVVFDDFCRTDGRLMDLEAPLNLEERTVRQGETIEVRVALFGVVSQSRNVYVATDSMEAPSALHGPGLPGLLRESPRSDLLVDLEEQTSRAGPGNATVYRWSIENIGEEPRTATVAVDGPADWFAQPLPTTLTVPAGATVAGNLTVAAPLDASHGAETKHTVRITSESEKVAFPVTTTVAPGEGTPAGELPGIGGLDPEDPPAWFEAAMASEEDADGPSFLEEFWVELLATAAVGAGALVVRLVR